MHYLFIKRADLFPITRPIRVGTWVGPFAIPGSGLPGPAEVRPLSVTKLLLQVCNLASYPNERTTFGGSQEIGDGGSKYGRPD